ncbi:Arm DNA-binding domain-containing protein [Castellaniella hirudinis]|uniref:Arm DNA-binding domain-containing protein n=1 Tax=Castellaniella hirudinis TaxID=1144617 RepID=UPI0039C41A7C
MGFLTDLKIRTASPSTKEYLLADGDGLYLRVRASSKSWLYRYHGIHRLPIGLCMLRRIALQLGFEAGRAGKARCTSMANARRTMPTISRLTDSPATSHAATRLGHASARDP